MKGKDYDNISKWLAQFLLELTEKKKQMYLEFCTSYSNISLIEDIIVITANFINLDDGLFQRVAACTRKLQLPVVYKIYSELKEEMMKALELECEGFADDESWCHYFVIDSLGFLLVSLCIVCKMKFTN